MPPDGAEVAVLERFCLDSGSFLVVGGGVLYVLLDPGVSWLSHQTHDLTHHSSLFHR